MMVKEVAEKLGLKILSVGADQQVTGGYVSDLLSDVIANAEEGSLWITVQRHLNIIAVAQLKKLAGIIPYYAYIDERIASILSKFGKIKDNASPELQKIRRD
ncbi:MAG: hypothetical protein NTW95_00945, partial [Candidatus Aminicenantes bacterium]|nr:hypothetical protein [Candidatus Aminicenantes bacterium]